LELNYLGNTCQQAFLQFEFNKEKAQELINQCRQTMANRFQTSDKRKKGEQLTQRSANEQNNQGSQPRLVQMSNTQSQFMSSSYGYDFDMDGSEIDDLDNEVANIGRKFNQ
jgi:hypothetical protein